MPQKRPNRRSVPTVAATAEASSEIVNARDLARRYKISSVCIGKWAASGKIPCIRFERTLRFRLADVVKVIEGGGKQ